MIGRNITRYLKTLVMTTTNQEVKTGLVSIIM